MSQDYRDNWERIFNPPPDPFWEKLREDARRRNEQLAWRWLHPDPNDKYRRGWESTFRSKEDPL